LNGEDLSSNVNEIHLNILRKIETVEDQKTLADTLGFSVGKINYILKSLIDKGFVKTERFLKSENKKGYKYLLTPSGIEEKLNLTRTYIEIKKREYEELVQEVENVGR
jgi:EPS-associated MarR family transcriptional regulator